MTRVLVVHHDLEATDREVDELRRAGYEVEQCAGPHAGGSCPVLSGEPCWQVEWADVLVYDLWAAGDAGRELIEDVREVHPDKPVVLTSPGRESDWSGSGRPHWLPSFVGAPARAGLVEAVEGALLAGRSAERAAAATGQAGHAAEHAPGW